MNLSAASFRTKLELIFVLRWLVELKLIQLEQQKTQLSFIILVKTFKNNTLQGRKRYIKLFELEINHLRVHILAAKMS